MGETLMSYLVNQCMFSLAYNAGYMEGICPDYHRLTEIMHQSGGAAAHTITDNLAESGTNALADALVARMAPPSQPPSTVPDEPEEDELVPIDSQDIALAITETPTLRTKNLANCEYRRDRPVSPRHRCAPPPP